MLYKQFAPGLVASLAVFVVTGNSLAAFAQTATVQTTNFEAPTTAGDPVAAENRLLLAHHEGATSSLGAVDILGTETPGGPGEMLSDSLWGNLLLQMAY